MRLLVYFESILSSYCLLDHNNLSLPPVINLVSTAETEYKVESRLLLDVVVRESTPVLKLLSSKDQTLLIRRNSFLVLDLGLHVLNGVSGLDIKSDSLTGQSLDENLQSCVERVKNSTKET
jgi:hypothetical protein